MDFHFDEGNYRIEGGKWHEMPAHHNLEAYLDAYIEAAGIREGGKTPLFRSAAGVRAGPEARGKDPARSLEDNDLSRRLAV